MSNQYPTLPAPMGAPDPYAKFVPPGGDHADFVKFNVPGDFVDFVVENLWDFMSKPFDATKSPQQCFAGEGTVIEGSTVPAGTKASVSWGGEGSRMSLYRQFHAQCVVPRMPLPFRARVTFTGYEGQAKVFDLVVAPANGAPVAQQAPAPQPAPAGFPPAAAPVAPAPAPQGFAPPQAPGTPPPWGAGAPAGQ